MVIGLGSSRDEGVGVQGRISGSRDRNQSSRDLTIGLKKRVS